MLLRREGKSERQRDHATERYSAGRRTTGGSKKFVGITLDQSLGGNNVSALQWDGTYLAIASQSSATIYQFAIDGSSGTMVGSTSLTGVIGAGAFWILTTGSSQTLYAPVAENESLQYVGVYPYPTGGKPSKKLFAVINP